MKTTKAKAKPTTAITVTLTVEGDAGKARRAFREAFDDGEVIDMLEDFDRDEAFDIIRATVK